MIRLPAASMFSTPMRSPRSLVPLRVPGDTAGQRAPAAADPALTPLFFIHGLGGHVAAFQPLARGLSDGRPVYGLQGLGLDAGQAPQERIEDMAAFYVQEIRQVQPRGPYLLAGWSMGGMIALDMARRLQAAGHAVPLVMLLDTYLTTADYEQQDLGDETVMRWIGGLLRLPVAELMRLSLDRQWARISEQAAKVEGLGVAEIRRLAAVCRAHLRASADYVPEPYAGRAVLFRAEESRGSFDQRWRPLCPGLTAQIVPGNHYTMLRKPHVDVLAAQVGVCLSARCPSAAQ